MSRDSKVIMSGPIVIPDAASLRLVAPLFMSSTPFCLPRRGTHVRVLVPELTKHQGREPRIADKIPLEHASGLLEETKEPLHSRGLHHPGRATSLAGNDVERASDTHDEIHVQAREPPGDEQFLLGARDPNEQYVRPRRGNVPDQSLFVLFGPIAMSFVGQRHPSRAEYRGDVVHDLL